MVARLKRYGLVRMIYGPGPSLGYGVDHGVGCGWLPNWAQHGIVALWNPVVCAVWGHALLDHGPMTGEPLTVCVHCSREWKN